MENELLTFENGMVIGVLEGMNLAFGYLNTANSEQENSPVYRACIMLDRLKDEGYFAIERQDVPGQDGELVFQMDIKEFISYILNRKGQAGDLL
jgi:hypothetical protein